ncbi:substrate-binding periplasmic protein [Marinimicrobium agarilyticum]|uniref:substrate-binding periplasmic protein n=1 Tax=Marinimicrobium agarilyticum TaxID=306546 RepID=UPI00040635AA|nr:transporter substrate-binding domain-containing protein [Marinimicrobium agarilyticum]
MSFWIIKHLPGLPLLFALWSGLLFAAPETEEAPLVIRYPVLSEDYGQTRDDYFSRVLALALDKAGEPYRLEPVTLSNFRESRSVMSVAKGVYDIHWMNTNPTREMVLRPIRIPLFKGLIGWRLLLLRQQDEDLLEGMSGLKPLKGLTAVQGHDWPDSQVLEANGLEVFRTPHWEGMFKMLYAGRVDYFPRSVLEIWDEQRTFEELDLVVDDHVVLYYPAAYYFFVRKDSHELAALIEKGLNVAIADGSFDRLLMTYFGDDIERANLSERRVIRLENPALTPSTPLEREELWYQP